MPKQLPPKPDLEQLKKQAKDLRKAHRESRSEAIQRINDHHPRHSGRSASAISRSEFSLQDAQLVIAREYGFPSWPKLVAAVTSSVADPTLQEGVDSPRTPIEAPMTADETEAALDYLGLKMERFTYEADYPHDVRVSLQHSVRGKQIEAYDVGTHSLGPGRHTLLLFVHHSDDGIEFAVARRGARYGTGRLSTKGYNAHAWGRLITASLPVGSKAPIFAWAANQQQITSFEPTRPVDDIFSEYEMAIVIFAEIQRKQE